MKSKLKLYLAIAGLVGLVYLVIKMTPTPGYSNIFTPTENGSTYRKTNKSTDQNSDEDIVVSEGRTLLRAFNSRSVYPLYSQLHIDLELIVKPYYSSSEKQGILLDFGKIDTFFSDTEKINWGFEAGSGKIISLTTSEYFDRYIYNKDFYNAPQISFNKSISKGNGESLENVISKVYNGRVVKFIEYYFPGTDPQYNGMDWQSLCLVYENYKNEWKLVGIMHNQWTP